MSLISDFRGGVRLAVRSPLVSLSAVLCLAIGIGSTSALYSVLAHVVLTPLSYPDAHELALLRATNRVKGIIEGPVSYEEFTSWRAARTQSFRSIAAFQAATVSLSDTALPERLDASRISDSFFETLGVAPLVGRTFSADETQPGGTPAALISEGLWRRQFGGDRTVMGRSIRLNGQAVTVVGVVPATFRDPHGQAQDCWIPLWWDNPALQRPGVRTHVIVARLQPGQSMASARREMQLFAGQAPGSTTATERWEIDVLSLEERVASVWKAPAAALFAAVLLVLVIACTNVAILLLARTADREREWALRLALGVGRRRLVQQLTIETLVLVLPAILAGILCAVWLQRLFIVLRPTFLSRLDAMSLDLPVLLVAVASATLTVAVCMSLPLRHAVRVTPQELVRYSLTGLLRKRAVRTSLTLLTVAEIALGVTLLVAATVVTRDLLARSPRDLTNWRDRLTIRVTLPPDRYPSAVERLGFVRAAHEQLAAVPGVTAVEEASIVPYDRYMLGAYVSSTSSRDVTLTKAPASGYAVVSPGYFATLGISLLAGRAFADTDVHGAKGAFVVSNSVAQRLWPGQQALGQPLSITVFNPTGSLRGDVTRTGEVVGVAPDIRNPADPTRPQLFVYAPLAQHPLPFTRFVLAAPPADVIAREARKRLAAIDPLLVPDEAMTLEAMLGQRVELNRFYASLTQLFAGIGLTLAIVGTYAVTRYVVDRRRYELGVRAAVGASPRQIFADVVRTGAIVIMSGLVVGCAGALLARRLIAALTVNSAPLDVGGYLIGAAAVGVAAGMAILNGAVRASRADPIQAVREL